MSTTKNIETPQRLLDLFNEYVKQVKDNPRIENVYNAKEDKVAQIPREQPLTLVGFNVYCFNKGIISTLDHYFMNYQDRYTDYIGICTHIRQVIKDDQIGGGMVGIYNTSITQRLNNLVDRADVTTDGEKIQKSIPLVLSDGRSYDDLKDELKPE